MTPGDEMRAEARDDAQVRSESDSGPVPYARAVGTIGRAKEFLALAPEEDPAELLQPLAAYYVLGHALELALKAILIVGGIPEKKLRRLGHDLGKILRRIPEHWCERLPSELPAVVALLNPMYRVKRLEYLIPGAGPLPDYSETRNVARKTIEILEPHIASAVRVRLLAEKQETP